MVNTKKLILKDFGLTNTRCFIDNRSKHFFFLQSEKKNYMLLVKEKCSPLLLETIRSWPCHAKELPNLIKESSQFMLFALPNGKLKRLTLFNITHNRQKQVLSIQKKLNTLMSNTEYNWQWELPYFFITNWGMMYIDIITLQHKKEPSLLTPKLTSSMNQIERILLKIEQKN